MPRKAAQQTDPEPVDNYEEKAHALTSILETLAPLTESDRNAIVRAVVTFYDLYIPS